MKAVVEGRSHEVVAADLPDDEWLDLRTEHHRVHRRMKSSLCSCTDCGHALHPKQVGKTRFFAHNPDLGNGCPLRALERSETADHRNLKLAIYKAVKREPGWRASIEDQAPDRDPVTNKPIIVDVTAQRIRPRVEAEGAPRLQGWEVQLGALDGGHALERQEVRRRWLERCTWVTRSNRPSWSDRIPWYQVAPVNEIEVVVDGVSRWDPAVGEYVAEDPFPSDLMVGYMLRGALWAEETGWLLEYATAPRARRRPQRREGIKSTVAEYCDRLNRLPEYARGWTDEDWRRYAPLAHDRRQHGDSLTDLDRVAISRCPSNNPELEHLECGPFLLPDYDAEVSRPCIHCGQLVTISVSVDYPLHHHCAWHLSRGTTCQYH